MTCNANESKVAVHCIGCKVKDDIALQFSRYFEIRKQHPNIVRLLCVYAPNPLDWHSND